MKKNLLFLLALLGLFTTRAAAESLLSYTIDESSASCETSTDIVAGNGFIQFGAPKVAADAVHSTGYAFKSDGDVGESKYILAKPSRALAAGDEIAVSMYAASNPSGSDYGIGIYTAKDATSLVSTLYLGAKEKNVVKTLSYTVQAGDGLEGAEAVYLYRAPGKSTYICAVEITGGEGGGEEPGGGDEPTTFNKTWNFSNWTAGDYTEQTTVDGLTLEASADKKITIDGSKKTVDGVAYTQRLKFGGTGNATTGRYLHFDVPGNCKITIVGAHSSSSGDDRNIDIAAGSFANVVDNGMVVVAGADPYAYVYNYEGEATTIYIYSHNSGINLYAVYAEASEGGDEPVVTIAKPTFEVDGVAYESGATVTGLKTGQRVTINAEEGMYIYTNWSSSTTKTKDDIYTASRMKGQTSYGASTSTGGQRVLYAVAGDTEDAAGNSSDLAYIIFTDVVASEPTFTVAEGEVEAGTLVGITAGCTTDIIRYTTDGTIPTADSPEYTAEIAITETTTVRAIAFDKNGDYPSAIVSATYVVPAQAFAITLNKYGLATFYDSKTAYDIPSGLTAYVVESVNGKKLTQVELDGVIPADCAVILEGAAGDYTLTPCATIISTPWAGTQQPSAPVNLLRGSDEAATTTGDDPSETYKFYALSAKNGVPGFYWLEDNGAAFVSGAHKAYLAVPVTEAGANSAFVLDATDGIERIAATTANDAPTYNLAGQRVSDTYKGVVIIGGKKVMK